MIKIPSPPTLAEITVFISIPLNRYFQHLKHRFQCLHLFFYLIRLQFDTHAILICFLSLCHSPKHSILPGQYQNNLMSVLESKNTIKNFIISILICSMSCLFLFSRCSSDAAIDDSKVSEKDIIQCISDHKLLSADLITNLTYETCTDGEHQKQ